jgi:hypothetical protein
MAVIAVFGLLALLLRRQDGPVSSVAEHQAPVYMSSNPLVTENLHGSVQHVQEVYEAPSSVWQQEPVEMASNEALS